MKKIISLLCASALLLGFTACADSSGGTDNTQATAGSDTDESVRAAETVPRQFRRITPAIYKTIDF